MILIAYGTRPEIIKLFPVIHELSARHIPYKTVFTGQQTDLYEQMRELIPPPDFSFAESFAGGKKHNTLGMSFIKISQAAERLFTHHAFDLVMVQGDTTTAWALAQMAFYHDLKVAHVEAGLRTFDPDNPFPEEMNRTLIDQVAAFNFAPTRQAVRNLNKINAKNIHWTGNTIVDAVDYFKSRLALKTGMSNNVLVTLHRRENHPIMGQLFDELQNIAVQNPEWELIMPIHPNPNVSKHRFRLQAENIHVVSPMTYPDMLQLMSQVFFMISDSGGIQEEAACFNKKVIIVRKTTERPEVVKMGLGRLSGREIKKYIHWAQIPPGPAKTMPYGEGDAAKKIVRVLYGS